MAWLRKHRGELIELLSGERCRYCGERIDWRRPGGVAFADGQAAHLGCFEQAEASGRSRPPVASTPHPAP
jgi:hypothetical protein